MVNGPTDVGKVLSPFLAGIEEPLLFMQQLAEKPHFT